MESSTILWDGGSNSFKTGCILVLIPWISWKSKINSFKHQNLPDIGFALTSGHLQNDLQFVTLRKTVLVSK